MAQPTAKEFVKVPKQEYKLLKEVFRSVQRQAFLVRIADAKKNLASGKTKTASLDDLIDSI